MAWGINSGLLDSKTYLPVATKAWTALLAARMSNGLLGYVQGVGSAPGPIKANKTAIYATGAFLLAAGQLSQLAPIQMPLPPTLTIGSSNSAPASSEPASPNP